MSRVSTYGLAVGLAFLAAGIAQADDVPPSGLQFNLLERMFEPVGAPTASATTLRLRYLAPELADREVVGFDKIEADFRWFCQRDGIQFAAWSAPMLERIIVSFSSEPVSFGETAPNVVQYFDAFRVENETCIWEGL